MMILSDPHFDPIIRLRDHSVHECAEDVDNVIVVVEERTEVLVSAAIEEAHLDVSSAIRRCCLNEIHAVHRSRCLEDDE